MANPAFAVGSTETMLGGDLTTIPDTNGMVARIRSLKET